jgi:hypothetical protein
MLRDYAAPGAASVASNLSVAVAVAADADAAVVVAVVVALEVAIAEAFPLLTFRAVKHTEHRSKLEPTTCPCLREARLGTAPHFARSAGDWAKPGVRFQSLFWDPAKTVLLTLAKAKRGRALERGFQRQSRLTL